MKRLLFLIILLSMPLLAAAELNIAHIDIVISNNNTATTDLAKGIQYALQNSQPGVDTSIQSAENYQNNKTSTTLIITIGDSSLSWLNDRKKSFAAAIAFHISSEIYAQQKKSDRQITALYRDQPLSRQLRLAKLLLPNLKRVTLLRSSAELTSIGNELLNELQVTIAEVPIENNSDWLKSLSLSLRDNDVLLGIDDAKIYNSENIRSILLTSYRHGKGLIGPSRAFVNAGSLASTYTSTDQYLQQLADMVTVVIHEHRVPDAQFPKIFRIAINRQVATSLNISIPDENTLSAWLQNYYGECSNGC